MVFDRSEINRTRRRVLKRRKIIWFSVLGVLVLLLVFLGLYQFTDVIFGISEDLYSAPKSGDWAMFRRDINHTGSLNPGGILPKGEIRWTYTTGKAISSSPAVVDGIVYIGSRDSFVYAFKADTGEKLWEFKTGSWVESSPAVVDGVVYFGSNDGYLYALDASTGAKRWAFYTKYAVRSSPAVADGVVFFGSDDYYLYAVDAATGKQRWRFETGTQVTASPVIADGFVVIGSADGFFYVLNANNGKARLKFKMYSTVVSSSIVEDSVAYFPDTSGNLYAIDIHARNWPLENALTRYWKVLYLYGVAPKPPVASGYIWLYNMGHTARQTSSPALLEGKIYLGAGNSVLCVDINTREQVWVQTTKDVVSSSPAVTDKAVFAGSQDGRFYALDRASGDVLWDISTGGQITSSPALVNGVIYVGSHDGKLYAIE